MNTKQQVLGMNRLKTFLGIKANAFQKIELMIVLLE